MGATVEVIDNAEEIEVVATTSRSVAGELDTDVVVVALGDANGLALLSVAVVEELLLGVESGLCTVVELVEELLRSEAVLVKVVSKTEAEFVVGPSVDIVEEIAELDEVLEAS